MCRITSVSGRSADQPRVSFGHVSPCETHQWFCFLVFDSCVVTSRTLVSSRRFFACRASFLLFQKIAHTCEAQKGVALVGGTHLDVLRLVLWKGADGVW